MREVLLSGFQLQLYVDDEKSFVYWELSHVAHEHLATLNSLEPVIPKGELVPRARWIRSKRRFNWQIPGFMKNLSSYAHILTLSDHSARGCSWWGSLTLPP